VTTVAASEKETAAAAFSWRFVMPLLAGSALKPVNTSLIATALVPIAATVHVPVGRTAVLVLGAVPGQCDRPAHQRQARRGVRAAPRLPCGHGQCPGRPDRRVRAGPGHPGRRPGADRDRLLGGVPSAMTLIRRRASAAGLTAPPGGVLGGLGGRRQRHRRPRPVSRRGPGGCVGLAEHVLHQPPRRRLPLLSRVLLPGRVRRSAPPHHQHPDRLDRGHHPRVRHHLGRDGQREPDHPPTTRSPPGRSAPPPACSRPSARSAPLPPPRSSPSPSTPASTKPTCIPSR
jgi:hypothetical protein